MSEKPIVSIVMPVYGVEKYLPKSLNSVIEQSFTDFELLLIDDCSPDKSGEICDRFALKDNRIKVFHLEKNGGVSNARNFGKDKAEGKYLLFLDSDDYVEGNLLEQAVSSMEKNPADVAVFGLVEEYYDKNGRLYKEKPIALDNKALKSADEVRNELINLEKSTLYGYPWNKLFNLESLRESKAEFPIMAFNEDIIFNINFFSFAKSMNILNITPYRYAKRSGSTTGKFIPTYYKDIMLKIEKLYDQFQNFGLLNLDNLSVIAGLYVRYFFSALERNFDKRSQMDNRQRKAFFDNELKKPLYGKLSPYMDGGGLSGIMAKNFKKGNRCACLLIARAIYTIKRYFPKLFEKLN
ncbi:MAG: glycosyltransferase family 2 protein [Clostridia bacterium]|nr:glycosyltransferase family 2 protein [Clostridia bacterium]